MLQAACEPGVTPRGDALGAGYHPDRRCAPLRGAALERRNPRLRPTQDQRIPYGVFEAADSPLVITVGNNAQFQRFCIEVIGRRAIARRSGDESAWHSCGRSA
jgi:hypothetical protein